MIDAIVTVTEVRKTSWVSTGSSCGSSLIMTLSQVVSSAVMQATIVSSSTPSKPLARWGSCAVVDSVRVGAP